jgi:hypothetical protein
MRLAASALGAGVPAGDFAGRIVEVHSRAALLVLAGEKWVTLVAPELGRQPRGITFHAPAGISLRTFLAAGAEVAARGAMLRAAGGALAIDLRGARPWRSRLDALRLDIDQPAVAQSYRTARSALDTDGRSDGLRHAAGAICERLADATRRRDVEAAERAMSGLIGLGEGRTPAGDDYLVGYFAALWSCSNVRTGFAGALGARAAALATHAGHLSRLYLQAAAEGEVSECIATVAAGVAAGSDDTVIGHAVAEALAVGHSSGAAGLLGLLDGCAACAETLPHARAAAALAPALPAFSSLSATLRQIAPSST